MLSTIGCKVKNTEDAQYTNRFEGSVNLEKKSNQYVAEACSSRTIELKLELLFGSNFQFRLERCVTNVRLLFKLSNSCGTFYQKIERISRAFIFLISLPCWLREQRLRKFNSKDFIGDEREIENEKIIYSVYKGN